MTRLENHWVILLMFHLDGTLCDSNPGFCRIGSSSFFCFPSLSLSLAFREVKIIVRLKKSIQNNFILILIYLRGFEMLTDLDAAMIWVIQEGVTLLPLCSGSAQPLLVWGPALERCLWALYNYVSTARPVGPPVNRVMQDASCNVSNCCVVDIQCMCLSLTHRLPFQLESLAFHVETV